MSKMAFAMRVEPGVIKTGSWFAHGNAPFIKRSGFTDVESPAGKTESFHSMLDPSLPGRSGHLRLA